MNKKIIAVDVGGTNIRVALFAPGIERRQSAQTADFCSAELFLQGLCDMVRCVDPLEEADAIGLLLPTPWTEKTSVISNITNVAFLEDVPISLIKDAFPNYTVYFENDVKANALLEAYERKLDNMIFLTVSTGISCGIVVNGSIYRGVNGYAGEIGCLRIGKSTVEELCGGRALNAAAKEMFGGDVKTLFDKFLQKDEDAIAYLESWKARLTSAMASVIQILAPEVVVLGGSVITCQPWLLPIIERETKGKLGGLSCKLKFELCNHGADEGLFGAFYCAKTNMEESL